MEGEMACSIKQQKKRKKTALHCFFAFSQRLSLLILKKVASILSRAMHQVMPTPCAL